MNVTIELPEDQAEALKAQAAARGLSVEAWVQSHRRDTPLISDEAVSRDGIYPDRI